jgi:predicted DCC family thiol-disulfide oxidoreductase YuxK
LAITSVIVTDPDEHEAMPAPSPQPILLFDGLCGFCTRSAGALVDSNNSSAVALPWQSTPDLERYGLTSRDLERAAYWIDERGRTYRGHRAVAKALVDRGGAAQLVGAAMLIPPLSWIARALYWVVARNRYHLSPTTKAQ